MYVLISVSRSTLSPKSLWGKNFVSLTKKDVDEIKTFLWGVDNGFKENGTFWAAHKTKFGPREDQKIINDFSVPHFPIYMFHSWFGSSDKPDRVCPNDKTHLVYVHAHAMRLDVGLSRIRSWLFQSQEIVQTNDVKTILTLKNKRKVKQIKKNGLAAFQTFSWQTYLFTYMWYRACRKVPSMFYGFQFWCVNTKK